MTGAETEGKTYDTPHDQTSCQQYNYSVFWTQDVTIQLFVLKRSISRALQLLCPRTLVSRRLIYVVPLKRMHTAGKYMALSHLETLDVQHGHVTKQQQRGST